MTPSIEELLAEAILNDVYVLPNPNTSIRARRRFYDSGPVINFVTHDNLDINRAVYYNYNGEIEKYKVVYKRIESRGYAGTHWRYIAHGTLWRTMIPLLSRDEKARAFDAITAYLNINITKEDRTWVAVCTEGEFKGLCTQADSPEELGRNLLDCAILLGEIEILHQHTLEE